ncbi:hypothetical protein KQ51_01829 [Candidatus Izimaplasma bacterium HR1]|jgi:uncharacterized protein YjbI with pentapeptide repeats|uniref:pentapeptide repeat-containing protein n=1 Tax=Candidatus Izimoplasma sp. HR1 TaxID=1541959 RepID=UPI0004F85238|nr:hypothetical protein KQ51_01829 [Candidatus Izimaplasma bacterium HR1]
MKKRKKPIQRIPLEEYKGSITIDDDSYSIDYSILKEKEFNNNENVRIVFDACTFEKCTFTNNSFLRSEFIDCKFTNCDLSNNTFTDSTFIRTEFINSKFIGSHFIESFINDILFKDSLAEYLDVANNKIKVLEVRNTDLTYSSWFENKIEGISFSKNNLTNTTFFKSNLKDLDISSCEIEKLRIDHDSIIGLIISPLQAESFCHLLGIKVK